MSPDDHFRIAPDVFTRSFDGETVVVDLGKGDYFGLNELGGKLWEGIGAGKSPREIASELHGQFAVSPEQLLEDLVALAREMESRALIARIERA